LASIAIGPITMTLEVRRFATRKVVLVTESIVTSKALSGSRRRRHNIQYRAIPRFS
jgi:hypothetical protein